MTHYIVKFVNIGIALVKILIFSNHIGKSG